MDPVIMMFPVLLFVVGLSLLVSGIKGAKWLVKKDGGWPWFMFSSRDFVRRIWGERGARWYAGAIGILLMTGSVVGTVLSLLPHR